MHSFKSTCAAVAILALAPTLANAGSYEAPTVAPEIIAPAPVAFDWSGFQLGIAVGRSAGNHDYYTNSGSAVPFATYNVSGPLYGAFAGYNMQRGNMVYGVELAYSAANVQINGGVFPAYSYDRFIDLKGRVGYAMDDVLVFGEIGGSAAHWGGPAEDANVSGLLLGLGVDVAVGDKTFVGLEYVMRDLAGDETTIPAYIRTRQQAIQLRVGVNF